MVLSNPTNITLSYMLSMRNGPAMAWMYLVPSHYFTQSTAPLSPIQEAFPISNFLSAFQIGLTIMSTSILYGYFRVMSMKTRRNGLCLILATGAGQAHLWGSTRN